MRQKTGRKDAISEDESDEDELRDTKRERNQLMQSFRKRVGWPFFQEVFVVSALNGNGIDNFKVRSRQRNIFELLFGDLCVSVVCENYMCEISPGVI